MRWLIGLGILVVLVAYQGASAANRIPAVARSATEGFELETTRISINPNGEQGNGISRGAAVSADGRWVAFSSSSFNLTDEDQSPVEDVFVYERETGALAILSTVAQGKSQDGDSRTPRITADGGLVVWESDATNLVLSDTNDVTDIFLRPRMGGEIVRLSVNGAGAEGNGISEHPDISADGTLVAFESTATNLVLSDTNGVKDVFVVNLVEKGERGKEKEENSQVPFLLSPFSFPAVEVSRISVAMDGTEANGDSSEARLSADGRYVVFTSEADNLVVSDTNGLADVFLHDLVTGVTERVSIGFGEEEGDDASGGGVVSPDGRYIVFESLATNFVSEDSPYQDIFLRDRNSETTILLSATLYEGANQDASAPDIAADGRYVVFASLADNLVQGDTNGRADIFRKDLMQGGTIARLSVSSDGGQGSDASNAPTISANGRVVAFESEATNLVPSDTNGLRDVFTAAITEPPDPTPQALYLPLVQRDVP